MSETKWKFEVGQTVQFALKDDPEFAYGKRGYIVANEAINPALNDAAREYAHEFPYRVVWEDYQKPDIPPDIQRLLDDAKRESGIAFGVGWLMAESELEAVE